MDVSVSLSSVIVPLTIPSLELAVTEYCTSANKQLSFAVSQRV
jgi:hypothetical protein